MTPEQITALTGAGESESLGFKHTTGTRLKTAQTTECAMLNQRGRHVLFGVVPKGSMVGQQVSERVNEEISVEVQQIEALTRVRKLLPSSLRAIERFQVAEVAAVGNLRSPGKFSSTCDRGTRKVSDYEDLG